MMKNTLLVLSTAAQAPKAIDIALARAQELGGKLIALFVVDVQLPASIFERLEGTVSVGEIPGQNVQDALMQEYKRQGDQQLAAVTERARAKGIEIESLLKVGVFADECIRVIREHEVEVAVISRQPKSHLSRFIFGSPIKKIQDNVECRFEIVDLE